MKKCKNLNIILANDTDVMRDFLLIKFEDTNHTLYPAKDGKEAYDIFLNYINSSKEVDVIMTDIKMPTMNGYELVNKCKVYRPELPVLLVSSGEYDVNKLTNSKNTMFITKHIEFYNDISNIVETLYKRTR